MKVLRSFAWSAISAVSAVLVFIAGEAFVSDLMRGIGLSDLDIIIYIPTVMLVTASIIYLFSALIRIIMRIGRCRAEVSRTVLFLTGSIITLHSSLYISAIDLINEYNSRDSMGPVINTSGFLALILFITVIPAAAVFAIVCTVMILRRRKKIIRMKGESI